MPQHQDGHDASCLLLRSHIAQCRVQGRVIGMPLTCDVLEITGEDDQQGHQIMLKSAEAATQDNRHLPLIPPVYDEINGKSGKCKQPILSLHDLDI